MFKVVIIGLLILFISTNVIVYKNGNITLNVENAKASVFEAFGKFVKFIDENS